jgi:drug/metabolite transporter (DMT)-like permease
MRPNILTNKILFARMSITVVLSSLYMWYTKTPHFPLGHREVRWLLVARGLGGFWGVFGMYYSLIYLPLADATVITFLAPSLTCWVCSFLLKEPFTKIDRIGSLVSLVGVVFIARPTSLFFSSAEAPPASGNTEVVGSNSTVVIPDASNYDNVTPAERLAAVGIALVGVGGSVIAYTTIRWIGKRAHPLISVNYFATWCTIVSIVAQLTLPGIGFLLPADAKEWGYLVFLG